MSPRLIDPLGGKGKLTDPFGPRSAIPGVVGAGTHTGQDRACPVGTPVLAQHDGKISRTWFDRFVATNAPAGGWMIEVDVGGGYLTRSAHLSKYVAEPGDVVKAGQVIAYSGQSGAATGPHLHQELLLNGRYIDPQKYITTTSTPPDPNGANDMFLAYYAHAAGKGKGRYAFFGPGFWLELESVAVVKRFKAQLGMKAKAYRCKTAGGWAGFKAAAQSGAPSVLASAVAGD